MTPRDIAATYPNTCSLCGLRQSDENNSECGQPNCPIRAVPVSELEQAPACEVQDVA